MRNLYIKPEFQYKSKVNLSVFGPRGTKLDMTPLFLYHGT